MATVQEARDALLRALEQLEAAEADLEGPAEQADLVVVYAVGRRTDNNGAWHDVGGWSSTAGPKWLHAALLRRAADAQDDAARAVDDDYSEDDD